MPVQAVGDPDYGPLLLDINIAGRIKDVRVTGRVRQCCGKCSDGQQTSISSL